MPIRSDQLRWLGGVLGLYALSDPPDPDNLAGFLPDLELLKFPAGSAIIAEGEPGSGLFVLRSGAAAVTRGGRSVAALQPGALIGEIGFITGTPRSATVLAEQDCEVFSLPHVDRFLTRYPSLRDFLVKTAQQRMSELGQMSEAPRDVTLPAVGAPRPRCIKGLLAGRYEINKLIGEGGMGRVYLGFDRTLERPVAVKQLHAAAKAGSPARRSFLAEARTVARLSHPFVVAIFDILEDAGELYLVMEFVDGTPLSRALEEKGPFKLAQCRTMFTYICQAVACAHWNHVLHRDLKPANIMLERSGFAKVMDFGLAQRTLVTGAREISGTPSHMAPEQHRGESGVASDVFALGICLYEALSGALPFVGPDYEGQKKSGSYLPLGERVPSLKGSDVEALTAKALAADPGQRPAGVLPFLEALQEC